MIAHLWELRADVTALERGAGQWARVAADLAGTADEIVDAARHAMDQGWESEAAERYEAQRRQIVQQIDTFTTVAARIGSSLTVIAGLLTDAQEELDRAWLTVSVVPHDIVGAERTLVLHPASPADEELVRAATATARAVRSRLQDRLYDESARLRESRTELGVVRSDLVQAARGAWPGGVVSGVGTLEAVAVPGGTTKGLDLGRGEEQQPGEAGSPSAVRGAAAGGGTGAAATPVLPDIAPIAVSVPDLTGLSAGALAAGAAGLAGGAAARRRRRPETAPTQTSGMAPMGGMAAGAALRGGGALGRPGGRASGTPAKPVLSREESAEERAARVAREKEQAREAKRQLIAERQAERAARRAQRAESEQSKRPPGTKAGIEVVEVAPDEPPRPPRG